MLDIKQDVTITFTEGDVALLQRMCHIVKDVMTAHYDSIERPGGFLPGSATYNRRELTEVRHMADTITSIEVGD